MELSARTLELGNVRAKYDRALVEEAHVAKEIAQLRVYLERQHRSYLHLKGVHDRLVQCLSAKGKDRPQGELRLRD